jgi:hypothetical protein
MSEKNSTIKSKKKSFGAGWLFTEDDDSNVSKSQTSENTNFGQNHFGTNNSNVNPANFNQTFQSANVRDQKIEDKLKTTLKAANLPGPDYFEFKQQLDVLKNVIPDERTRFAAAFSSLTVQGIDKNKILESAHHYIKLLGSENGKFEGAIASMSDDKVGLKEKESRALLDENSGLQKQIDELGRKISENSARITVLGGEISQAKQEIEGAKQRFQFTLSSVIDDIQKDADKVNAYIQ